MEPATSLVSFIRTSAAPPTPVNHSHSFAWQQVTPAKSRTQPLRARGMAGSKSGAKLVSAGCKTCRGKGAIECPGCKGTGKNKKNGNIFERWKCFDCQGFGLKSCPSCGKGGLTPEQRGER